MLVSADWVLPIAHPPIERGAVLVEGDRIRAVGTLTQMQHSFAEAEHRHFANCAIMPGLVNAHTHLSLSAMQSLLAPSDFEEWLPGLVAAMRSWSTEDFAASAALGAQHCLEAGVTVVGDIAYGPESAAAAAAAGLGGVAYWEVLGVSAPSVFAELERLGFPANGCIDFAPRIRCGLSPHSIYTSPPDLLDAVHRAGLELNVPVAIHLAESRAEVRLSVHGDGPLSTTAARLIGDFRAPGIGPIEYLDRLGVLDAATAVHLGETEPADIPRLAATVRGAVTCPRSNRFLGNSIAPIDRMIEAGIPIGVGTDSSASNEDLDLFEDVRLLGAEYPSLSPTTLLELVTLQGAITLGEEHRFGTLEPGMYADLAVFELGASESPEQDMVKKAGRETLRALMSSGRWRVEDGRSGGLNSIVEAAVVTARAKARAAIDA